jgi:hypothetical protein
VLVKGRKKVLHIVCGDSGGVLLFGSSDGERYKASWQKPKLMLCNPCRQIAREGAIPMVNGFDWKNSIDGTFLCFPYSQTIEFMPLHI